MKRQVIFFTDSFLCILACKRAYLRPGMGAIHPSKGTRSMILPLSDPALNARYVHTHQSCPVPGCCKASWSCREHGEDKSFCFCSNTSVRKYTCMGPLLTNVFGTKVYNGCEKRAAGKAHMSVCCHEELSVGFRPKVSCIFCGFRTTGASMAKLLRPLKQGDPRVLAFFEYIVNDNSSALYQGIRDDQRYKDMMTAAQGLPIFSSFSHLRTSLEQAYKTGQQASYGEAFLSAMRIACTPVAGSSRNSIRGPDGPVSSETAMKRAQRNKRARMEPMELLADVAIASSQLASSVVHPGGGHMIVTNMVQEASIIEHLLGSVVAPKRSKTSGGDAGSTETFGASISDLLN